MSAYSAPVLLPFLAVLGLIFGSFVTALSYRVPRGESIAKGRSRCPACGATLTARDLVPVVSWLMHRGACRHCGVRVSWRYPVLEVLMAALFVAAALMLPPSVPLVLVLAMTPLMMASAVVDLEHGRVPNGFVVILAVLALAWRYVHGGDFVFALTASAATVVLGLALDAAYRGLTGRTGLGMGDTKLCAVAALALPLLPLLLFLSLAGTLGVIGGLMVRARGGGSHVPFAPAILASYWLCLFLSEDRIANAVMR